MLLTSLSLAHIRPAPLVGTQVAFILRRKSSGLEKHVCLCVSACVCVVCVMQRPREVCVFDAIMCVCVCVVYVCVIQWPREACMCGMLSYVRLCVVCVCDAVA